MSGGLTHTAGRLADAERQLAEAREALEPFAWVGQWLFARQDVPDSEPMVTITGLHSPVHLTRGMFKAAHLARESEARAALQDRPNDAARQLAEARAALERDRTAVADGVSSIRKVLAGRAWMQEGRGSFTWDDETYQLEFGLALGEIEKALEPLARIAKDWSNCPTDPDEIAAARASTDQRLIDMGAQLAAARNAILDDQACILREQARADAAEHQLAEARETLARELIKKDRQERTLEGQLAEARTAHKQCWDDAVAHKLRADEAERQLAELRSQSSNSAGSSPLPEARE